MRITCALCMAIIIQVPASKIALSEEVQVRNLQILTQAEDYTVSADFNLKLNPQLVNAVESGLMLHFNLEFELYHARWYWFNKEISKKRKIYTLSYHALSRKYRLGTGALYQTFDNLEEAVRTISHLRSWKVIEAKSINESTIYQANLILYLNIQELPKPFQINTLKNNDWDLSTGWIRWEFAIKDPDK